MIGTIASSDEQLAHELQLRYVEEDRLARMQIQSGYDPATNQRYPDASAPTASSSSNGMLSSIIPSIFLPKSFQNNTNASTILPDTTNSSLGSYAISTRSPQDGNYQLSISFDNYYIMQNTTS